MRTLQQLLNVLMLAFFLFAAVLQYNDDDVLRWVVLYLAAAGCCIAAVVGKLKWWVAALVAAICLAWTAVHLAQGAPAVSFREMFTDWGMKNPQVAEEREMLGLGVIAAWMILLALLARRTERNPEAGT